MVSPVDTVKLTVLSRWSESPQSLLVCSWVSADKKLFFINTLIMINYYYDEKRREMWTCDTQLHTNKLSGLADHLIKTVSFIVFTGLTI